MTLIRWTPNRDHGLATFHGEFDRFFDSFFSGRPLGALVPASDAIVPPVDVEETKDGFVFHVDLPGIDPKQVKISLLGDTLTLRGERKREKQSHEGDVHRTERVFGSFERSFTLPAAVRGDEVKAAYANGVLDIRVPKAEEARVREIEVQVG